LNLLINSVDAIIEKSPAKRGIRPVAEKKENNNDGEIMIYCKSDLENVFLYIKDNGIGIPENKLDKIFDPFFTTKQPGQGTGLGLSISYNIIKQHNGEIKVESEYGIGTLITIVLPIYKNH